MNALKLGVIVSKSTAICLAKIDFKQEQLKKPFLYRDWCHKQMQKYGTRNSHVTCNIQSDCFNLELKGNASLKFVWHWRLAFFYIHTGTVSKKLFDSILANKSRRTKLGATIPIGPSRSLDLNYILWCSFLKNTFIFKSPLSEVSGGYF